VREVATGIERAAKFFFPERNPRNRTATFYAKKLHKLRHSPIVIQYHTQETVRWRGTPISFLVSEYVEGELLSEFLARQPGGRLTPFQGLHLLHALASGIESIHHMREYHGDLHTDNVVVRRFGLGYNLKLIDMFHWGPARKETIHDDVVDLVRILYDALGGQKHYARNPPEIKAICCGLKRTLILKKFRSAGQLREYLETMQWS
jgi:tRNA A-37 threonylcarbamoyl transferase component Bud32